MTTLEDRVARLEGAYEHMAAKADFMGLHSNAKLLAQEFSGIGQHMAAIDGIIKEMIARLDALENPRTRPMGFTGS